MPKRPAKQHFSISLDSTTLLGVGSVSGLKKTRESKIVFDGANNVEGFVVAGTEKHEEVTVKGTLLPDQDGNIKTLEQMWEKHRANDPEKQDSRASGQIVFYTDADFKDEAGRYNLNRALITGLGIGDKEREESADPDEFELTLQPASGGWKTK